MLLEKPRSDRPWARRDGLFVGALMALCSMAAACGHAATMTEEDAAAACTPGPDGSIGDPAPADCPNDYPDDTDCPDASPSYQDDIAPIVGRRCMVCHTAGGIAPTPLLGSYAEIHLPRTQSGMLTFVYGCRMPPSCAPQLTADERKKMLKWFSCNFLNN